MTFVRNQVLSLAAVLLVTGLAGAQDPLEQARQQAVLKAQKLRADVKAFLSDASKQETINPERARDLLRKARNLLEDDNATLPDNERNGYLADINQRLNQINNRANVSRKTEEAAIERSKQVDAFRAKLAADNAKVQNQMGPSAIVFSAQKSYKDQQLAMVAQQQAYIKAMQDAARQQQNPQYYKPPVTANTVSDRDVRLMRALDSYLKVDFKGTPMKEVLEYLEDKSKGDLNFILDEAGLKEAGVNDPGPTFNNDPVTKQFKKIKVRALLRLLLAERGMKYYFDDGNLMLTKDTKADKKLVVRMYPVANSVGGQQLINQAIQELQQQANRGPGPGVPPGQPAAPPTLQLGPNGELLSRNIDGLTNQIKGTIDPDHWQGPANGPGSMVFVPASASLQIHCSLEVHYLIMASGLLDKK